MAAAPSKRLNLATLLRFRPHRRTTIRHLLLVLGASALVLSTFYYTYLGRDEAFFLNSGSHPWSASSTIWTGRAARVKEAFRHAYRGYEDHAFLHDELLPVSNMSVDNFNGWGVTIVDSLDTMLLMGLEDEYTRALPVISHANFSLPSNDYVPFFETVIRYLGGLLGAYAISGHDLLRDKADELGSILAPAFNTTSGFPFYAVDTFTGRSRFFSSGVLAEIASCQLEYAYLGKITGKKEHVDHATLITNALYNANLNETGGAYPDRWNLERGAPTSVHLSVGAASDSGHEYTLKQFLMTARTDRRNLEMYLRFTSYIINNFLFISPKRGMLYVTDGSRHKRWFAYTHVLEHLSCFFPGLLALGAHLLPLDDLSTLGINVTTLVDDLPLADRRAYADLFEFKLSDLHLWAAEGIAQTCYLTYADQPTGLGPDYVRMNIDSDVGEIRWMDALRAWKAEQSDMFGGWWNVFGGWRRQSPPGVGDIPPYLSDGELGLWREDASGRDYLVTSSMYLLRPETVESLYILWQTTGDAKWRERAWRIFEAIERHAKTESGYAVVEGVHTHHPRQMDSMPSYFMAETLKYLYLMFEDEDLVPLDRWVFNTEAHPFPVFEWTAEEREAYEIL